MLYVEILYFLESLRLTTNRLLPKTPTNIIRLVKSLKHSNIFIVIIVHDIVPQVLIQFLILLRNYFLTFHFGTAVYSATDFLGRELHDDFHLK